jgi:hypothetical protein
MTLSPSQLLGLHKATYSYANALLEKPSELKAQVQVSRTRGLELKLVQGNLSFDFASRLPRGYSFYSSNEFSEDPVPKRISVNLDCIESEYFVPALLHEIGHARRRSKWRTSAVVENVVGFCSTTYEFIREWLILRTVGLGVVDMYTSGYDELDAKHKWRGDEERGAWDYVRTEILNLRNKGFDLIENSKLGLQETLALTTYELHYQATCVSAGLGNFPLPIRYIRTPIITFATQNKPI